MGRATVSSGLRARRLTLAALLLACAGAHAGHDDVKVDPALRRNPGKITALAPGGDSFEAKPLRAAAFVPGELRGWRLTMLGGKRFGDAFPVKGNTESRITLEGALDGVAVGDLFIVEEISR